MVKGTIPPKKEPKSAPLSQEMGAVLELVSELKDIKNDFTETLELQKDNLEKVIDKAESDLEGIKIDAHESLQTFETTAAELIQQIRKLPQLKGDKGDPVSEKQLTEVKHQLYQELMESIVIPKLDEVELLGKFLSQVPKVEIPKQKEIDVDAIAEKFKVNPVDIVQFILELPAKDFQLKTSNIQGLDNVLAELRNRIANSSGGTMRGGGDTVVAGANITVTRLPNGSVSIASSGGSISDGDKGDITVSSSGTVWTLNTVNANVGAYGSSSKTVTVTANEKGLITAINEQDISILAIQVSDLNNTIGAYLEGITGDVTIAADISTITNQSVTYAKIQDVSAASKLLGRGDSGAGSVEEITIGSGLTMTGTTLSATGGGGGLPPDADYGDITVSGAGTVWTIDNSVVTLAKMADIATDSILGRATAGTGAVEVLTALPFAFTGDVTRPADSNAQTIANNAVTLAKMATIATDSILGRATAAAGNVEVLTALPFAFTGDVTRAADSNAQTIATSAVTLAKMADVATSTVFYRKTAGTGVPEVNTLATLKTDLGLSGTNTGDQTITLTGDVTGSGTGSFAATIASGAVTLAKMANMATSSLIYRKTAGSGVPEVNTLATLKTDLGLTGTNSGDQTITLTGDVTGSGTGSFAATIANNAVTLAKMATMATDSILGRATAATGNVEVLTALPFAYTGDVTRPADSNATTIANSAVTYAKIQNVSAASKLLGRGSAGGAGNVEEITVGTGLSMSGTTLSATGGGGVTTNISLGSIVYVDGSVPGGNTVANTTTETAFTSSYTITANNLSTNNVIRINMAGVYSTAVVAPTITAKVKIGSTVVATTGAITAIAAVTNGGFTGFIDIIITNSGASGAVEAQGYLEFATAATTGLSVNLSNTAAVSGIDFTTSQAITVTVQWGTASASNTVTLRQMEIDIARITTSATYPTLGLVNMVRLGAFS